jgi:signal transduction histidine kinase
MALAGIDALRVLGQFQKDDARIRSRYLSQNHLLNDVRSDVYVSGTYVRDYLLEPDPERANIYLSSLEDVRKHMESALDSYARQANPAEISHYRALRTVLTNYWGILAPVLQWDAAQRHHSGYAFLRDELFPRRQNMLALADQIARLNEQQLNAGNDQVVSLLLSFKTRLLVTLVAALVLGMAMAAFSTRTILSLESQARLRYLEVVETRGQLKELSARLVQAQETERKALSRELHDEVGQSLSAVLIELRNLSAGLDLRSHDQSRNHVETIKGVVEGTIRVVRNMSLLLRPSMLDDLGLIPALRWQAREASKHTSMNVSVATDFDSDNLPEEYNTCIYRVVQEALHNTARHSRATTVRIKVQRQPGALVLTIQDDGQGFDVRQSKGLGLIGIEERVTRIGGRFQIYSQPGSGAVLSAELPFPYDTRTGFALEANSHSLS